MRVETKKSANKLTFLPRVLHLSCICHKRTTCFATKLREELKTGVPLASRARKYTRLRCVKYFGMPPASISFKPTTSTNWTRNGDVHLRNKQ